MKIPPRYGENLGLDDCLARQSRYRSIVPYVRPYRTRRRPIAATALALTCALALGACAGKPPVTTAASRLTTVPKDGSQDLAGDPYWWREAGDPVLADLVETGLTRNRTLSCEALSLRKANARARSHARRIDTRVGRLFDTRGMNEADAEQAARAFRFAAHHSDLATRIALAYIETRHLQEILVTRTAALAPTSDNAEIAAYREEAGLVSGVDTGLAGTALSTADAGTDTARTEFEDSREALARLVGLSSDEVQQKLGEAGAVPDFGAPVPAQSTLDEIARRADLLALERSLIAHLIASKVSQPELDAALAVDPADSPEAISNPTARAAVVQWRKARDAALDELAASRDRMAEAARRQSELDKAAEKARATLKLARLAYRTGTGDFAALYVAEQAALKLDEARIAARTARTDAAIRSWAAQGLGWTEADLDPPAPLSDGLEVLVCD
ncbi:TolC family protein [Novosphingobium profundi]|uniref:TolC family protein n=1 Tax=Novosphingobium profundi TaxID=1774954 RepID=UPI001BD91ADF|nr:TolC family protein [Novosphingobium profundi]MBT0667987.1 TolC family protein [Novosphingobium profundi]